MESVTRTTEFVIELSISTRRALLMDIADGDNNAIQKFDTHIDAQKAEINDDTYHNVIIMMAYSYQELTDPELDEYIRFYETVEGGWFITQAVNALIEAFRIGASQTGKRIAALIRQKDLCTMTTLGSTDVRTGTSSVCTTNVVNSSTHAEPGAATETDTKPNVNTLAVQPDFDEQ